MKVARGNAELAQKVRKLRLDRGLTLREVEAATGISNPYLSQLEHAYLVPGVHMVARLAAFYGVSLDYLAGHMVEEAERE